MIVNQFIAGLIALIYQGQTLELDNVRNIQGALFIYLTNMTFQNIFAVVNVSVINQSLQFSRITLNVECRSLLVNCLYFYVSISMECIERMFIFLPNQ